MAISLMCYNGHPLTVGDEFAGRKVVCPICELTVPVPEPPRPVVPRPRLVSTNEGNGVPRPRVTIMEDEEETPGSLGPAAVTMARGLGLHHARLVLYLLSILAVIVALVATVAQVVEANVLRVTLQAVGVGFLFVGPALGIAASALSLGAAGKARARGFVVASLASDLAAIGVGAVLLLMEQRPLYASPLPVCSWVFFMFFLRGVAVFLDQPDYVNDALVLVVKGVGLVALGGFLIFLWWALTWFAVFRAFDPDFARGLEVGLYILTTVWLVFLIRSLLSNLEFLTTFRKIIRGTKE